MASLIENLIAVLEQESELYDKLTEASKEKTGIIIANDIERLTKINEKEQSIVDEITRVSHKRDEALNEIATVLGKDAKTITVSQIIESMEKQPEFQHPLINIKEKLVSQVATLKQISSHNQELLQESLEITEYTINLIQSMNQAPETANYSKGSGSAYGGSYSGTTLGGGRSAFDAKQ